MTMFLSLIILSMIIYMISMFSMKYNFFKEKLYSFECGFNPFSIPRNPFSIQFFKILLIFLIFDMEIIIILPSPLFQPLLPMSYVNFIIIMLILITGLIFEWKEGSLEWLN